MQVITANTEIEIEKHFKVVAGPGAGKTKFLVNHIKNVLTNSVRLGKNRKVACITYTNVGVDALINRIEDERDHIDISTIHSFLFKHVVKPYMFLIKEKYGLNPEKIENPFEHIVSKGYFNRTDLPRRNINETEIKNLYWEIEDGQCILRLKKRNNLYHKSLLKYKTFFWKKGIIHYDDILSFAWEVINSDSNVERILRAKFPYFFIDEFQDTSPIQAEILKKIAEAETIVGVIGDEAQSIYSFQGASMQQFSDFTLSSMNEFVIQDNHRSTNEIIDVLKLIRGDLEQNSPLSKTGKLPKLFIGNSIKALDKCERIFGEQKVVSLSYMVPMANAMRKRIDAASPANHMIEDLFSVDSNRYRKRVLVSMIKAVEFAKQSLFSDAIKELSYHFKTQDQFKGQKSALIFLKSFLNEYESISNERLWDLYERLQKNPLLSLPKIRESQTGNMSKVESFYKQTPYSDIALTIRLVKDESLHRTIHKAKGDEFNNVLVIVKGKYGNKYKEKRDIAFLLTSDLKNLEEHRVNYVACSRARENLIINVPEMTLDARDKLDKYFEINDV